MIDKLIAFVLGVIVGAVALFMALAVYVTCTECGCRTRQMNRRVRVESQEAEERRVEDLTVKAWNRRTSHNDEQQSQRQGL